MSDQLLRVFVSSKMGELAAEREAVKQALDRLHVKAWVFEKDAGARPSSIQETYLEEIEAADLYIGIFWKGYGAYTIEEFEHAQTLGMDCLIYEKQSAREDPRDPALQNFLDRIGRVTAGLNVKRFQTAESLAGFVAEDVAAWQARIVRERGAGSAPAIYSGVPPMPAHLVGRDAIVTQLVGRLRAGEDLAIEGLPGVGKTSLAVMLTRHRGVRRHFRDGILWTSLGPNADVTSALVRWSEALQKGAERASDAERAQMIRDAIGGRRMLLVIDDVWDVEAARNIRCGGPNCAHLMTTRDKAVARAFAGAPRARNLPTLDSERSGELLRMLAPEAWDANPEAARGLLATAAGLPLAIRLIGGYLAAPERALFAGLFPDLSEEAFAELNNPRKRLDLAERRLGARGAEPSTLRDTVLLSLEGLPGEIRQAFYALGAFEPMPARFSREAAEIVTAAGARALAVLAARNLLEIEEEGRQLTLHRTISDVAYSGLDAAARARHGEHYFGWVASGSNRYDRWSVMDHYPQISRAWRSAPEDERLFEWLLLMRPFFVLGNAWLEYVSWAKRALDVAIRLRLVNQRGALLAGMGFARYSLEDWPVALSLLRDALPALEEAGDRRGYARALCNVGMCHYALGDTKAALETIHEAITILNECGDTPGLADAFRNLSAVYTQIGDDLEPAALNAQAEMLRDWTRTDEPYVTEIHMVVPPWLMLPWRGQPFFLALLDTFVKQHRAAADFEGNLVIGVRREEDGALRFWQARFEAGKQPVTGFVDNRPDDADATLLLRERDADAMISQGGFPQNSEPVVYGDRGLIHKLIERYLRQAPEKAKRPDHEAAKLVALGVIHGSKGQWSLGLESLDRAVQMQTRLVEAGKEDLRADLADSLDSRAWILGAVKRYEEALQDHGEAIRIRAQLVVHEQRADLAGALADSLRERALVLILGARWAEAVSDFDAAIALKMRAENLDAAGRGSLADDYRHRAMAREGAADPAGAIQDLARAIELYGGLVDAKDEGEFADRLAAALSIRAGHLSDAGRYVEALTDYDRAIELRRQRMQRAEAGSDADLAADLGKRAQTHARVSDTDLAVRDLEEAIGQYSDLVDLRSRGDLAQSLAEALFECALFAFSKPMLDEAIKRYTRLVVEQGREDLRPRLALAYRARATMPGLPIDEVLEDLAQSITIYEEVLQHRTDPALALELAQCFTHRAEQRSNYGSFAGAIDDYESAVALYTPLSGDMREKHSTDLFAGLNGLAWIRATCADASLRDGRLAVEHATRACELTGWSDYQAFDTLAAAHAEAGNFESAVEWQLKATEQASEEERAGYRARVELYRARTPYRDAPAAVEPPARR